MSTWLYCTQKMKIQSIFEEWNTSRLQLYIDLLKTTIDPIDFCTFFKTEQIVPPPPSQDENPPFSQLKHYWISIDAHGICTEILISGLFSLTFQCAFNPTRLSLSYADHRLNFSWKLALLYSGSVCRLNMKFCIFLYVNYAKIDRPILTRI